MKDHDIKNFDNLGELETMMGLYKQRMKMLAKGTGMSLPARRMSTFMIWDNGYMAGYAAAIRACREGRVVDAKPFSGKLPGDEGYGEKAKAKGET